MAVDFQFKSGFACERALQENDNIYSAIRIVDIFYVPAGLPDDATIPITVIVSLRTAPVNPDDKFTIGIAIVKPSGERERLPSPMSEPLGIPIYEGDPSIPSGITMALHILVKVKHIGTSIVEIDIGGPPIIKIPFTLRRVAAAQPEQKS